MCVRFNRLVPVTRLSSHSHSVQTVGPYKVHYLWNSISTSSPPRLLAPLSCDNSRERGGEGAIKQLKGAIKLYEVTTQGSEGTIKQVKGARERGGEGARGQSNKSRGRGNEGARERGDNQTTQGGKLKEARERGDNNARERGDNQTTQGDNSRERGGEV